MSVAFSLRAATWGSKLKFAEIPDDVINAARRAIIDTIGVIAAGSIHPAVASLLTVFGKDAGPCSAVGSGQTLTASAAAMVNGAAAHAWDFDDTSYTGIMHGSAVILPAIMAAAQETNVTEEEFLIAFIVGSEVAYTLADSCRHAHYFTGWWSTVTFGLAGATAAAARLYGLDEEQFTSAMGMSGAAAGGGKAVFGTDGKPFLVGDAARRGLEFAKTAAAGLSGPLSGFEGTGGFYNLLNKGEFQPTEIQTLGQRWRLIDPGLLVKTSPVCSAAHAAIEQLSLLMKEASADAEHVLRIEAEVPDLVYISMIYTRPESPQQAQFSLPYALACTLLHGRVRIEDLVDTEIISSIKRSLMEKVSVVRSNELSNEQMRTRNPESAKITLYLNDGRSLSGFCGQAYGMPKKPLTEKDLMVKYKNCLEFAGLSDDGRAKDLLNLSLNIVSKSMKI